MKLLSRWLCVVLLAGCSDGASEGSFVQDDTGIVVTPASGGQQRVRLQVRTDRTVRVTSVSDANLDLPESLMVVAPTAARPSFKVEKREQEVLLSTARLVAHVSLANGAVKFTDASGKALLSEAPLKWPAGGVSARFNPGTDEAFYGSGQHQNSQLNLN